MSSNMLNLLKNIYENDGVILNNLIKSKVITRNEIIKFVLETNEPYLIYCVAKYIKGLSKKNIDKLACKLIELKSIKYMYDFAKNIKRAPIDKLADFTMEYGTFENIYNFAKDVDGSPVEKMAEAVIQKGIGEYIYKFAVHVKDAPVTLLVGALAKLNEGYYLAEIAKCTKDEMIKNMILDIIINKMNNAKYVYNYARVVENAPIDRLVDSLIMIGNSEYIYKFAKDIEDAPVEKLADAIIKINDPEYIYSFAKWVSGAPIGKLADAIIDTKDITYIDLFKYIEGAPVEILNIMKNRIIIEVMTEEERLEHLLELAQNNDIKAISCCRDIYRDLFLDEYIKQDNLNSKVRVLKLEKR